MIFSEKSPALAAFIIMQRYDSVTLPAYPFTPLCGKKCDQAMFPDLDAVFDQALIISVLISFIHLLNQFTGKMFA